MLFPGPNGSASEIDLDVSRFVLHTCDHILVQASARKRRLAWVGRSVETFHTILEDFFLSDQSNLIRSYPCRPAHFRKSPCSKLCCLPASLDAYAAKTMPKLLLGPTLVQHPCNIDFVTSRADEARDKSSIHLYADVPPTHPLPCRLPNTGRNTQAINLKDCPRTWIYFRLQPRVEWVGCDHTEDGSTYSSPVQPILCTPSSPLLRPQDMHTIDTR